jgi:hypothetical protein
MNKIWSDLAAGFGGRYASEGWRPTVREDGLGAGGLVTRRFSPHRSERKKEGVSIRACEEEQTSFSEPHDFNLT